MITSDYEKKLDNMSEESLTEEMERLREERDELVRELRSEHNAEVAHTSLIEILLHEIVDHAIGEPDTPERQAFDLKVMANVIDALKDVRSQAVRRKLLGQ